MTNSSCLVAVRYHHLHQRTKSRSPASGSTAGSSSRSASGPSASGPAAVSRSSSNPESLSADEARRRMLNWRKATTFRKTSGRPTS